MFDLKMIREAPDAFDAALQKRGLEPHAGDILALDEKRRDAQTRLQEMQTQRNDASAKIGQAKAKGDEVGAQALIDEVAALKTAIQEGEDEERRLSEELEALLAGLPNMPAADVPVGADARANKELRREGTPPKFDFAARSHNELGETLGLMDFQIAAKLSGARFVVLKGALARMERALAQFMLDMHTQEFGYLEVHPPLLLREAPLFGTGQLPKFAEDLFRTTDDYWLLPTAEVPLTNLVREQILAEADLPLRFTACTPCFRSEAGAAGKDTRGMIRQHQFTKVELVSITTPGTAEEEHDRMTACAEEVLKRLELPYRVVSLCTGDLGFAARRTYDLEVWLPSQAAYREISSCSWCGDFQARRMQARYRSEEEKGTRFVHTLNGSGLAIGRTLVAIMENFQQADGSIRVPASLRPYMDDMQVVYGYG